MATFEETRFQAMGSEAHLIATGPTDRAIAALGWANQRIADLEDRWSRFRPDSEVSRANAGNGDPVSVGADTLDLVERAVEAWRASAGAFDPTVLQILVDHGYKDALPDAAKGVVVDVGPSASPGCSEISIDRALGKLSFPSNVGFDPGGLGKGLAADIVVAEMLEFDIDGALVNIGGDLRCAGLGPTGNGEWHVSVGDEVAGVPRRVVALRDGAIASSTCRRRRWNTSSGEAHHLIDVRTGRPSARPAQLVTVIAENCCDADWLATSIAVIGDLPTDRSVIGRATVILTTADGDTITHGPIEAFLR